MTDLKPWPEKERAEFRQRCESAVDGGEHWPCDQALELLDLYEAALNDIKLLRTALDAQLEAGEAASALVPELLEQERELVNALQEARGHLLAPTKADRALGCIDEMLRRHKRARAETPSIPARDEPCSCGFEDVVCAECGEPR